MARAADVSGRLVLDGPARPLANVRVTLRYVGSIPNSASQEARRTHSGADGRFHFSDVEPGIYVLDAGGEGVLGAAWGASGPELAGRALDLGARDSARELTIHVQARPMLCGKVLDLAGRPAVNVQVSAWKTDAARSFMRMGGNDRDDAADGGNTTTDRDGIFRFTRLTRGYYVIGAFSEPSSIQAFWNDGAGNDESTPIPFLSNDISDACSYVIQLVDKPPKPAYDGPRYHLEGSLAHRLPRETRKLEWELYSLEKEPAPGFGGHHPFDPRTGTFAFDGVPPGRYRLMLEAPLIRTFSGPCFPLDRHDVDQEIVVTQDVRNLRVEPRPAADIVGRIIEIRTAHDLTSSPSKGERYSIGLRNNGQCGRFDVPSGSFVIHDVPPGIYTLRAASGKEVQYTSALTIDNVFQPAGFVDLHPGENDVRITQRFDSGVMQAQLPEATATKEKIVLFDSDGALSEGSSSAQLRPGVYTAVAGINDELTWVDRDGRWRNQRLLAAIEKLGTTFTIEPGKTTNITLDDHTVEIQNLTAEMGLEMYRR